MSQSFRGEFTSRPEGFSHDQNSSSRERNAIAKAFLRLCAVESWESVYGLLCYLVSPNPSLTSRRLAARRSGGQAGTVGRRFNSTLELAALLVHALLFIKAPFVLVPFLCLSYSFLRLLRCYTEGVGWWVGGCLWGSGFSVAPLRFGLCFLFILNVH